MSWPLHPEQPQTLARNNFLTPFLCLPALWETVTFAENLLCAELIGMIIIIPTVQMGRLRFSWEAACNSRVLALSPGALTLPWGTTIMATFYRMLKNFTVLYLNRTTGPVMIYYYYVHFRDVV